MHPDKRAKEFVNTNWKLYSTDSIHLDEITTGYFANFEYLTRSIETDSCTRTLSFAQDAKCVILDLCNGQPVETYMGHWEWYEETGIMAYFPQADTETESWMFLKYSPDTLQFMIQYQADRDHNLWKVKTFVKK